MYLELKFLFLVLDGILEDLDSLSVRQALEGCLGHVL